MARVATFDIMKGIGIIAVIMGHIDALPYNLRIFIFSFHMPLFFIIAGYFFKPNNNFKLKFEKDFSRLVIPYLFSVFFIFLMEIIVELINNEKPSLIRDIIAILYGTGGTHFSLFFSDVPGLGPIWFLLALFWCRLQSKLQNFRDIRKSLCSFLRPYLN